MRSRFALFAVLTSFVTLAAAAACSSGGAPINDPLVTSDVDGSRPKRDSSVDPPPDDDGGGLSPDATTGGPGRVYAHTKDTLYLYEPVSGVLTAVAPFTFDTAQDDIIDIAVDRTGKMYGTTFTDFFSIDPITAKCTFIATALTAVDYPNSLSFVPAGTVDPGKEALVGYATNLGSNEAVTYVRIDTATGDMTTLGDMNAMGSGPLYRASGDIVSIIQDRTYVTVKLQTDGGVDGTDRLAEVDPTDGHIKQILGDTQQTNIFGFGYWAGKGYGFSDTGRILEINMATGGSKVLQTLMDDGGVPLPWYGAGVTTQAPTH